jgi:hypothetical protein
VAAVVVVVPVVVGVVVVAVVVRVVVVVLALVVGGLAVVVVVGGFLAFSSACWKAANVAASTAPVGSTPSAVWNCFRVSVRSWVQMPSMGPLQ